MIYITFLIPFVSFGIYFGISVGYFNHFRFFSGINKVVMQIFQCIPIVLWILILIILVNYIDDLTPNFKLSIYFLSFGLISSPALANLIIEKIKQMKNEDFIVALKLLGLKDMRIIFSHMLKYYCKSIIFFQMAYIMAHTFFLDLTLSYIGKGSTDPVTFGYYISHSMRIESTIYDLPYLIVIFFMLIFIFYYIANSFKEKVE